MSKCMNIISSKQGALPNTDNFDLGSKKEENACFRIVEGHTKGKGLAHIEIFLFAKQKLNLNNENWKTKKKVLKD